MNLLRPHQQESVRRLLEILRSYDSAVDASDTGTGKTWVAMQVIKELQLPTLVIGPKISKTAWLRTAEIFQEPISYCNYESLRTGNTPFGCWEGQSRINAGRPLIGVCGVCQRKFNLSEDISGCPHHPAGIHCFDVKRKLIRYGAFMFHSGVKFICADECHRAGSMNSLNSELLIASKRQKIKTLFLSATLAQSPLRFKAIGLSLDLFTL